jgi:hypothetical protein
MLPNQCVKWIQQPVTFIAKSRNETARTPHHLRER